MALVEEEAGMQGTKDREELDRVWRRAAVIGRYLDAVVRIVELVMR